MLKIDYVFSREYFSSFTREEIYNCIESDKIFIHRDDFHIRTHFHTQFEIVFFSYDETTLDWQAKRNRTFCGKHELNSST